MPAMNPDSAGGIAVFRSVLTATLLSFAVTAAGASGADSSASSESSTALKTVSSAKAAVEATNQQTQQSAQAAEPLPAGVSGQGAVKPAAPPSAKVSQRAPGTSGSVSKVSSTTAKPSPTKVGARASSAKTSGPATLKPVSGQAGAAQANAGTAAAAAQAPAVVEEHVTYHYNTLGRRDPFQSLVEGEYVGHDVGGDAPPDIGGIKVVGIVWGEGDRFALIEDARGNSHVLRRGDKVMNGFVEELKREAVVINTTSDGQTQSVTIPLTRKGEQSNAKR